jgi:hypothetical protein
MNGKGYHGLLIVTLRVSAKILERSSLAQLLQTWLQINRLLSGANAKR